MPDDFAAPGAQLPRALGAGDWDAPSPAEVGALLESMSDPVALIGADGRLRLANAAYRQLLADAGLSEGPISAAADIVKLRDRRGKPIRDSDHVLTKARKGESIRGERVLRMADGRDRVFSLSTSPVRGDGGAVLGVAVVWRDITQQIARERALRLLEDVRRGLSMSGDLRRAARSVCVRAVSLLTWVDMAAVFALDGDELRLMAQSGFPERAALLLPSMMMQPTHQTSIALRENRATVFQTDRDEPASESSRRVIAASGAATFVNLPLASGTQQFGLLTLASRDPHSSHPDDLALLGAMAAQVGLELEAVRRREQAETERSRLQAGAGSASRGRVAV
ncbi:MAG TPA: PAS domain-containing protein [Dehalococcoidia bacterium]